MTPPGRARRRSGTAFLSGLPRLVQSRYGLVLLGLGVLLILGLAILTDYGTSMDEGQNAYMGRAFLKVYETGNLLRSPGIAYFNGPFYFMVFTVTSRLFHALNPRWLLTDGLHLTNYLTFLVGVFFFYRIALRLLPRGLALFVMALFATQPVFYGHAFINQKDTPLMVFFLASVELGWTAVERRLAVEKGEPSGTAAPVRREGIMVVWKRLPLWERVLACAGVLLSLMVLLDLWWVGSIRGAAEELLPQVYQGNGPTLLVGLFGRIAEDAYKTPLRAYMAKLASFFVWGRLVVSVAMIAGMLGLWKLMLPESFSNLVGRWMRQWGAVVLAGIVLGMATSIRVLAPFAGLLVCAYWIGRSGKRAVPGLLIYGAVAMATTYLTWPALWGNPLVALTHRATGLSEFADHSVHLWGVRYDSGALPWNYLPTLLVVQLTLPAVVLFFVGTPYSWILSARDGRLVVALVWLWLLLPVAAVMLGWTPIYNSFRHVLFALPPAFLIMGIGLRKLFDVFRAPALQAGLVVVALAPGIVGIVRLHPYEYIYYNELVGGVRGAEGRFDLDYWCTSFREATAVINRLAELGDHVALVPSFSTATPFAREDLMLVGGREEPSTLDFALACRRGVGPPSPFPDMEAIYEVRVDGALLAVVTQRR